MAFENSPSTGAPQQPAPKSKSQTYILAALVVALLGTWGYVFYDKSETADVMSQKDQQLSTVNSQKDSLTTQMAALSSQFDALKTSDVAKDSALSAKDREIEGKKQEIESILRKKNATAGELAKAKTLIASLQGDIEGYKQQIEELKAANTKLTQEKEEVTTQRDAAQKNLDSTQNVVKQKEDVISLGSTFHISNFAITGLQDKKDGKEKETSNAKKIDKLHITFTIDENLIAQTGKKSLYVQITGPDGKLISDPAAGSGDFQTRDGQTLSYTMKVDVDYVQGQKLPVSADWKKQSTPFTVGSYKIAVYNNGLKVGEGTVELKKGGLFG